MNAGLDPGGELGGTYDPISDFTSAQIPWEYSRNFPAEAYAPEPDWLTKLWKPVDVLWGTGEQFVERTAEKLPELLWGYGLSKLRKVDEGAGVTVLHTQAPYPGGTPAQPTEKVIAGQVPFYTRMAGAPPQAVGTSTMILIGAGLIVLFILLK